MKIKNLVLGLSLSLFILCCNKDEDTASTNLNEAKVSADIDIAVEDISKIIEDQYALQVNPMAGRSADNSNVENLPPCATVSIQLTATTWTRTIVYNNCELPNGNVLDGTLIVSGSLNFNTPTQTINYTFVDFHHNNILIEGTRTVVRTFQSTAQLNVPHPVATMSIDITVTFPNGNSYHRVGNRVREMIEGFGTPAWMDNIFSITGSWTTTFPGGTQTSTITSPLRVRANCPFIVRGVVSIVRNNNTAILDYGNGECDNQATLTVNGTTTTITLGN